MSDLSAWIMLAATGVSAAATVVSALAAWRMWMVSQSTLNLQASVEEARKPLVHIWYNQHGIADGKTIGSFTLASIGGSPLPIRRMRVLFGPEKEGQATEIAACTINHDNKIPIVLNLTNSRQEITDIILQPNQLSFVEIVLQGSQLRFEVMYYDNSFEFIEIDTSNLGGKYILTGQGRK
jgi:hypothetical protein